MCFLTSRSSAQFSVVAGNVALTRDKSVAPSVSEAKVGNDAPLPPTGREGGGRLEGSLLSGGERGQLLIFHLLTRATCWEGWERASVAAMQIRGCISAQIHFARRKNLCYWSHTC